MARAKKRTPQVEDVRPSVEAVAKNLLDRLYGPDGPAWATKRTEIEDLFLAIRELLTGLGRGQGGRRPVADPEPHGVAGHRCTVPDRGCGRRDSDRQRDRGLGGGESPCGALAGSRGGAVANAAPCGVC